MPCRLIGRTSDSGSDYHGSSPCGAIIRYRLNCVTLVKAFLLAKQ